MPKGMGMALVLGNKFKAGQGFAVYFDSLGKHLQWTNPLAFIAIIGAVNHHDFLGFRVPGGSGNNVFPSLVMPVTAGFDVIWGRC